ncbi:MAG: hypothetical protein WCI91_02110 [Candidatus Nomurabacteria bacterium]
MKDKFKLIGTCKLTEKLDPETINLKVYEGWRGEFSHNKPSNEPKFGEEVFFFVSISKSYISYHDSISLLLSYGLKLPNAYGITIVEPLILGGLVESSDGSGKDPFAEKDQWLLGLDYWEHLPRKFHFGHLVPYTRIDINREISRCWHQYRDNVEHNDVIFGFGSSV